MNVTVNGTRPAPPSPGEVAGILSERIRNGVMKAGGRMPTQESLSDEFGVERGVIRQALRLLEDAGLLTGRTRGPRPVSPNSRPAGPRPLESHNRPLPLWGPASWRLSGRPTSASTRSV